MSPVYRLLTPLNAALIDSFLRANIIAITLPGIVGTIVSLVAEGLQSSPAEDKAQYTEQLISTASNLWCVPDHA